MISRRSMISNLLVLSAGATAAAIAAAIPTVSIAVPTDAKRSISLRMADLIAQYKRATAALDAIDVRTNPDAWEVANASYEVAQDALLDQCPVTGVDFAAKFDALLDI